MRPTRSSTRSATCSRCSHQRRRLGGAGQGDGEHVSERTPMCVSERAHPATPPCGARRPPPPVQMGYRSGGHQTVPSQCGPRCGRPGSARPQEVVPHSHVERRAPTRVRETANGVAASGRGGTPRGDDRSDPGRRARPDRGQGQWTARPDRPVRRHHRRGIRAVRRRSGRPVDLRPDRGTSTRTRRPARVAAGDHRCDQRPAQGRAHRRHGRHAQAPGPRARSRHALDDA